MGWMIDITKNKVLGPAYLEAREEGREQGREEGREEGREQGQLHLLRRLIERKFGSLPKWLEEKLSQSSAQEIEAVSLRVLDAATLEDLFH